MLSDAVSDTDTRSLEEEEEEEEEEVAEDEESVEPPESIFKVLSSNILLKIHSWSRIFCAWSVMFHILLS